MSKLKVPSVQHLARNWRGTPEKICNGLVQLAVSPPSFNYNPLYAAIRDLLVLRQSYESVAEGIRRGVKRSDVRENLLSVLPLIRDYFSDVRPDFVQGIDRRYYSIGRGLKVPFDPPLVYGIGGKLTFPWFSFWRSNPLNDVRLSLFVTLVDEILADDPDLAAADFQILDFSAPKQKRGQAKLPRELKIIPAKDIARIDDTAKIQMLEVFAEGYFMALAKLSGRSEAHQEKGATREHDPRQSDLFDKDISMPT